MKVELSSSKIPKNILLDVVKRKIPHDAGENIISSKGILVAINSKGDELLDTNLNIMDLRIAERSGQGILDSIQYDYKIIGNIHD